MRRLVSRSWSATRPRSPPPATGSVGRCGEDGLLPFGLAGALGLLWSEANELPLCIHRRDGPASIGGVPRRVEGEGPCVGAAARDPEGKLGTGLSVATMIGADATALVVLGPRTARRQLGHGLLARDDAVGNDDEGACTPLIDVAW